MKKVVAIFVGLGLVLSLTGFSVKDSAREAVKSLADHKQISDDKKDKAGECPYLSGEIKSSCPYLNKTNSETKTECPYLNGDAVCPFMGKKSDDGSCPYFKDKEKPAKNYRTIKQTST